MASFGYRCADRNRTVLFDTATGAVVSTYLGHDGTVFASTANADGSLVATGGGTRHAIQVWDPLTGERRALLQGAGSPVTAVGIAPDGGSVAWGSDNPCPERVSCPDTMGTLVTKLVLPAQDRFFDDPRPVSPDETYARAEHAMGGWRLAAKEGGKDGLGGADAGGDIDHREANLHWRIAGVTALQGHHAGRCLDHMVVSAILAVRPALPPARNRAVNDVGPHPPDIFGPEAKAPRHSRTEILDEHVGGLGKF